MLFPGVVGGTVVFPGVVGMLWFAGVVGLLWFPVVVDMLVCPEWLVGVAVGVLLGIVVVDVGLIVEFFPHAASEIN